MLDTRHSFLWEFTETFHDLQSMKDCEAICIADAGSAVGKRHLYVVDKYTTFVVLSLLYVSRLSASEKRTEKLKEYFGCFLRHLKEAWSRRCLFEGYKGRRVMRRAVLVVVMINNEKS